MGQILSIGLEDRIQKVISTQSFPANSRVHIKAPDFMLTALEFIKCYKGLEEEESYNFAVEECEEFLTQIDLEDNLHDFRENFKIDWINYPYEMGRVKSFRGIYKIENPFLFNLIMSEFEIAKKKVFNYIFEVYIQLFINEYNGDKNQKYRLYFPSKEEAKKNVKKTQNLEVLRALNQFKRIDGFTKYDIIVDSNLN